MYDLIQLVALRLNITPFQAVGLIKIHRPMAEQDREAWYQQQMQIYDTR